MTPLDMKILMELTIDSTPTGIAGTWRLRGADTVLSITKMQEWDVVGLNEMGTVYLTDLGKDLVSDKLTGLH